MKAPLLCLPFLLCAPAIAPQNFYESKEPGFRLEVPVAAEFETESYQMAMFLLPASDSFTANVNVMRQKFDKSIGDYDELSTRQFEAMKLEQIRRELKGNAVTYEYKGEMQGRELHFYSKAVKNGVYIDLATATALEGAWEKQKAQLVRSVDSFAHIK